MAIKHDWKIIEMDVWKNHKGYSDVVLSVNFSIETSDDAHLQKSYYNGSVAILFDNTKTFTPFDKLTNQQVIQWVKDELKEWKMDANGDLVLDASGKRIAVADKVPTILAENEKMLQEFINPTIVRKLPPWQ